MEIGWLLPTQVEDSIPPMKEIRWNREKESVLKCEKYGFDCIGVPDHLQLGKGGNYEVFSSISSLISITNEIEFLSLVASIPFRNPALLAKMAATLDNISNGRFDLGIGAGWHKPEFLAYGYEFEDAKTRVDRLEEAAELIKKLWEKKNLNFNGNFYETKNCTLNPKPKNSKLLIGGQGKRIEKIAKKYADEWNFPGNVKNLNKRVDDKGETKISWFGGIIVSRNEKYTKKIIKSAYPDRKGRYIAGKPKEIIKKLKEIQNKGVDRVILRTMDYPEGKSLDLLGKEIIPEFS